MSAQAAKAIKSPARRKRKGMRADYGQPADGWFKKLDGGPSEIANLLRRLVRQTGPDLVEALKWGMPTYTQNDVVCAIAAYKSHVTLYFHRGVELSDPGKRLEGTASCMRGLKVRAKEDIESKQIQDWIREAMKVDSGLK